MTELSANHYICPDAYGVLRFLNEAVEAGYRKVALTRAVIAEMPIARLRTELVARELRVTTLNSAGFFTWAGGKRRSAQREENKRLIEAAAEIDAAALCIITGGCAEQQGIASARALIADGLAELDEFAAKAGVKLGLEPIHPRDAPTKGCINSIAQAIDLIEPMQTTGLILDLFHSWWDPDLMAAAGRSDIRMLQICNVTEEPRRSPFLDDGMLDVAAVVAEMRAAGYDGAVEFEVFAADHGQQEILPLLRQAAHWAATG